MLLVLSALAVGLSAGCADSSSDDYRAYHELPADADQTESVDVTSAQPGDAKGAPEAAPAAADERPSVLAPVVAEKPAEPDAATPDQPQPDPSEDLAVAVATPDVGEQTTTGQSPAEDKPVREVKLLVEDRDFKTEGPEEALRISYDDFDLLKILNMDPVTPDAPHLLPDWLKNLDGQRVRVRGFMYPPFQETGIVIFVLARDNQICCFGRDPKVYDLVKVTMRLGTRTSYSQNRPFDVVGLFHILPNVDEDTLVSLYEIDDALVID